MRAELAEHGAGRRFGALAVGVVAAVGERGRSGEEERAGDREGQAGGEPGAARPARGSQAFDEGFHITPLWL